MLYARRDYTLVEVNTSNTFANGSLWPTSQGYVVQITGRVSTLSKRPIRGWFEILVAGAYRTAVHRSSISKGNIRNLFHPSVVGKGFQGIGVYSHATHPREYAIWKSMLERCYSLDSNGCHKYLHYEQVVVDTSWYNFQTFCEDIKTLPGYKEWEETSRAGERNSYVLDKDILYPGNTTYAKDKCMLVKESLNSKAAHRSRISRQRKILAKNLDGRSHIGQSKVDLAKLCGLDATHLARCLAKNSTTRKGWSFSYVDNA